MPKVQYVQHALNAGEISPLLYGRTDVPKYGKAVKRALNSFALIHGGQRRRFGTRFIGEVKDSSKQVKLAPFVLSRTVANVIELGDFYARVYDQVGQLQVSGVPVEITTPWAQTQLAQLRYTQQFQNAWFVHQDVAPRLIQRFSEISWKIRNMPFTKTATFSVPSDHQPIVPDLEIQDETATLDSASAPTSCTVPSSSFIAADVGRHIEEIDTGARALITAFGSVASISVGNIENGPFSSTSLSAGSWRIVGPPQSTITPSGTGPIGSNITLTASANTWKNGSKTQLYGRVLINGGVGIIIQVSSPTVCTVTVLRELESAAAAGPGSWDLLWPIIDERPTASDGWGIQSTVGYPGVVSLFDQRLLLGSTPWQPVQIWGSDIVDYEEFTPGVLDDEAFDKQLAADQANEIVHLVGLRDLIVLTEGSEWTVSGEGSVISATKFRAKQQSSYGASDVRPVKIGTEVLYIQRGGLVVRSVGYRRESETLDLVYDSADLSLLAEHITESGIVDLAYQQLPHKLVWMPRTDGKCVLLSIDRAQDVSAFGLVETDGEIESVATIPNGDTDQLWLVVKRTIQGQTKRYIEVIEEGLQTDSAITGQSGIPTTTWSGLSHLEGKTVDVIGDGVYLGTKTVSAGVITLSEAVSSVEIGLHYDTVIETLTPEIAPGVIGTGGSAFSINNTWLRVHESVGALTIAGDPVVVGAANAPYSGLVELSRTAWTEGDGSIEIRQTEPYDFTLLSVIQSLTVNAP